jgi:ribosomal protein S27AE
MVVHREYLKCSVCGTIIALRTQIGWLKQYPIRIYCGKCETLIEGSASINHSGSNLSQDFLNASTIRSNPMPIPDFVMEASGELLVDKLQACKDGKLPENFSPFLKTMNLMDLDMMTDFAKSTGIFLHYRTQSRILVMK